MFSSVADQICHINVSCRVDVYPRVKPTAASIPSCAPNSPTTDKRKNAVDCTLVASLLSLSYLLRCISIILRYSQRDDSTRTNVGVYVSSGELELANGDSENWIYLFEVNEIKVHGEILTKLTTNERYIRIQNIFTRYGNDTDTCYRLIQANDTMFERYFNCSLVNGTEVYFHFKYIPPSRRHLWGNIQYNARKTSNGSCGNETSNYIHVKYFNGSRYETEIQGNETSEYRHIKYFNGSRYEPEYSIREHNHHHLYGIWKYSRSGYNNSDARYKFHSISYNLEDLKNHWSTTFCNILNTSPDFNPDIPFTCTP